jgi:hypothetical protein
MALWTAGERVTATKLNDRNTPDNSNLSHARYVQTTANKSNGSSWGTDSQFWFNTARSTTTLITHSTAGSPLASTFTINKTGVYTICSGIRFNGTTGSVYISKGGIGDANIIFGSGVSIGPVAAGSLALTAGDTVMIRVVTLATTPIFTTLGDLNYITFQYGGQPA